MLTTFFLPTRIVFGCGSFARLGAEAAKIGRRAILVTGQSSMRKAGILDRAVAGLEASGVETVVYDRVEPNPRASTVDEGARLARENKVDLVIGLGGGSAMDAAKGMVLATSGTEPVWRYIVDEIEIKGPVPRLILVPSVAASGSEANNGAVITNWQTHQKCVFSSPHTYPVVSIVDPELTLTLPARPTRQGGIDIFCHLVEPYITDANPVPLTDGLVELLLRLLVEYLPLVLDRPGDIDARTQLSWLGTIGCSAFTSLGGGGGAMTLHGIEHALSGYYDIAHGDGLAALLPAWMRYTSPAREDRFRALGMKVFGRPDGILATEDWLKETGMRLKLREMAVEPQCFLRIASTAIETTPWLKSHPRPLGTHVIARIYHDAY
jgi:alcohol dehydrogenase YqhD (iron-dependent ADH family)